MFVKAKRLQFFNSANHDFDLSQKLHCIQRQSMRWKCRIWKIFLFEKRRFLEEIAYAWEKFLEIDLSLQSLSQHICKVCGQPLSEKRKDIPWLKMTQTFNSIWKTLIFICIKFTCKVIHIIYGSLYWSDPDYDRTVTEQK